MATKPYSPNPSFLWGAATSAHQIEGGNVHSDWWTWEQAGNIEGGVTSGAAADHVHKFKEDLLLAAGLNLNSYRFSVEWAKVEPEMDQWNAQALDWYDELLSECERLNLKPMVTLHHFTSPQWMAAKGGFSESFGVKRFLIFVEKILERFGPRIPLWCVFNEPIVLAVGSYFGKFMPPAVNRPDLVSLTCKNLFEAHARAYTLIHAKIRERSGPWKDHPIEVGTAHNMLHFIPGHSWNPLEILLCKVIAGFYNHAWLNAITGVSQKFGVFGLIPRAPSIPEFEGKCTVDFLGINYYTKAYVTIGKSTKVPGVTLPFQMQFARKEEPQSDIGWAVHPSGFQEIISMVARYKHPIYITENGIADGKDALRGKYLVDHLAEVAKAIEAGVPIKGYFHWSLLDNFEWIKGFGPRFGLYHVDYTNFERSPRPSSKLLREIVEAHEGIEAPCSKKLQPFKNGPPRMG